MEITTTRFSLKELYTLKSFFLMILGVMFAVLALKWFMIPNKFLDGGVTGISLLLHEIFHVNFSVLVLSINLIFFIPAYKYIGKLFAIRSFIAVVFLAFGYFLANLLVPEAEAFTKDKILISVFGGCSIGLGMGLVIRSGAALDGFEVLAIITTRKSGFSMSEVILFFNSIIFITAYRVNGIDSAMFSIITYFAALKMADYVSDGIEEFISLTIISKESERIKSLLVNDLGKGITVYKGERGYLPGKFEVRADCDVIVTIVTRLEMVTINNEINKIDSAAFMYTNKIKEVKGGVSKRKSHH